MKELLKRFAYLFIFWIGLFFLGRVIFFSGNSSLLSGLPLHAIIYSFGEGFRLDWSMSGYFFALPFLFSSIYIITQKYFLLKTIDCINYIFIALYSLTVAGETCLYREWKSKLSMQAMLHFTHPSEVFKSASMGLTILFFSITILLFFVAFIFYKKKISFSKTISAAKIITKRNLIIGISFFVVTECYAALSIRGGWQTIPIQSSDAYFSNKAILNDAAVNPFWNISYSIMGHLLETNTNPYDFFPVTEAKQTKQFLFGTESDTTIAFLTPTKPNIVFIILEGWSADCISSFGGDNFAPFMDSLCKNGIYFTNVYAAGFSSDQGIPAVLSSYPATTQLSITQQNTKSVGIPAINKDLKEKGYTTSFLFGGDLNYGNIKSYLYNTNFDQVIEEKDIDARLPRGGLGIQDKEMAREYVKVINKSAEPFMHCWFTLSSHMPFDFAKEFKPLVNHRQNDYINSIAYANEALQIFFEEAQHQKWYSNTLFVLVSDHSHETHADKNNIEAAYHKIPCVFYGNCIKPEFRGKSISKVYSQLDIAPTLLNQLGLKEESKKYVFGKNMLNPYSKNFAYTSLPSGATFIYNDSSIGYQNGTNRVVPGGKLSKNTEDSLVKYSHTLEQLYFSDYKSR